MAPQTSRPSKTVEDYLALPDDVRAELIGGEFYVPPAPTARHQDIVGQIYRCLADFAERTGAGRAYIAPLDVHLDSGDIVQPDVLFITSQNMDRVGDWIRGAPDLAVEVISPLHAARDRLVKRGLYARNGIPATWIVDPADRTIEVLRLEGDVYGPEHYFQDEETLTSPRLPGLRIPLPKVFR